MVKAFITSSSGVMQEYIPKEIKTETGFIKVDLNKSEKFQEILGFGAAFTDSSCYMIDRLENDKQEKLLKDLFSVDGLNLNCSRLCVGASDYARVAYNYDNTPEDMDLKDFSIDYDREYIIPTILKACKINPEHFLYSSPWSPPGWMKTGGAMEGGWMRQKYLEVYARYYLKFLQEYEKAGIKINALTTQNETETDQVSRMPACLWHPEFEMEFVRDYLKPLIDQNGLDTKIWLMDHNYIMWKRAKWMLNDEGTRYSVEGVAFHGYEGTADMMTKLHEAYPDKGLYWTEGGPGLGPNYEKDWCRWSEKITEALSNWCKIFTGWNYALDENGNPNIGPFKCAGLVTINSVDHEITYSGQFHSLAHYSKFVERGAFRIGSSCSSEDIFQIAFINPDDSIVLVVTNPGEATNILIKADGETVNLALPENSIATVTF